VSASEDSDYLPIDPSGFLADLKFASDSDGRNFQCLLDSLVSSAEARQILPRSVHNESKLKGQKGSYATWCRVEGSGREVESDLSSCDRFLVYGVKAPGTRALQLFTQQESPKETVQGFGYRRIDVPDAGDTGWFLDVTRSIGKVGGFKFEFIYFDGQKLDYKRAVRLSNDFHYVDSAIKLREKYTPEASVDEQLAGYKESPQQLISLAGKHLTALLSQVEASLEKHSALSAEDRTAALERAQSSIALSKNLLEENADEMHRMLLDRLSYDECL